MRLYFSSQKSEGLYSLANRQPPSDSLVTHEVDLADRVKFHNYHSYPYPIVQGPLSYITESIFLSEPFEAPTVISGSFTGELTVVINKKDFDLGVTVYEAMPDGKLFHLGYALHRASYAREPHEAAPALAGQAGTREVRNHPGEPADAAWLEVVSAGGCDQESGGAGELRHRQGRERRVDARTLAIR